MQSIDGWGVWFRLLGEIEKAEAVPPTRRCRADLPLKGGGAIRSGLIK